MKFKYLTIVSLVIITLVSSCNFNMFESGMEIDLAEDTEELALAKKSLSFIQQNKKDSLKQLFSADLLKMSNSEQLAPLYRLGKRVIENNTYPHDSIVTVSTTTRKSVLGEETFKEFNFPFINTSTPDSTMYFKITIADGQINKLLLSTGRRYIK